MTLAAVYSVIMQIVNDVFVRFTILKLNDILTTLVIEYKIFRIYIYIYVYIYIMMITS